MKFKLAFHPLARTDLVEISSRYEVQQLGLGVRFEQQARNAFQKLIEGALHYSIRFADIRRVNLPSFPHGVFYFVCGEEVVVLALMHGAQDFQSKLERRRAGYES